MIPPIKFDEPEKGDIGIPILGSNDYCWLKWHDEENITDFLINNTCNHYDYIDSSMHVYRKNDEEENGFINVTVYEVFCKKTKVRYFLIIEGRFYDPDCIFGSVCLPHNKLNLIIFFRDYLLPFSEKDIAWD